MASSPIPSWWIEQEKTETVTDSFLGLQNHGGGMKSKDTPWKKSTDKHRQHIKKQRHHFGDKNPYSQSYGFPSSHVQIWELVHKEGWEPQNWCFQLWCWRRLLRASWASKRSNQLILKEINPQDSLEELIWSWSSILWPSDSESWLFGKDPDAGKDWR